MPGGHGLQDHQAEGVGQRREDEDVGAGEVGGQLLAELGAGEHAPRDIWPPAPRAAGRRRPPPWCPAGRGRGRPRCSSRPPPGRHRGRSAAPGPRRGPARPRRAGGTCSVSTPRDQGEMLRKPWRVQLVAHGRGGHHQPARRLVEPAHVGVAGRQRQRQAGRDIFREAGVVAGGEGQLPLQADAPRRQADRAFGGDVDGLGLEGLEALLHRLIGAERQLDLGIGRQREGLELVGA